MQDKVQIVLDADVIIHFSEGGYLLLLPNVLPDCSFVVLSIVRNELRQVTRNELDKQIAFLKNIELVEYNPTGEERREFARLTSLSGLCLGKGESACMTYARYHSHVVGSSNLRDISEYCKEYGIAYLTTCDFLFYAYRSGIMNRDEVQSFVEKVRKAGSKLVDIDLDTYTCMVF